MLIIIVYLQYFIQIFNSINEKFNTLIDRVGHNYMNMYTSSSKLVKITTHTCNTVVTLRLHQTSDLLCNNVYVGKSTLYFHHSDQVVSGTSARGRGGSVGGCGEPGLDLLGW